MTDPNDDWSLKEYRPPESLERWFFRKNLAPSPAPGDSRFRHVAYVTLHFEPRDQTGLPQTEVERLLFEIEECGLHELESRGQAIHVASVLKAGVKDLLFYTSDREAFLAEAAAFCALHSGFSIECKLAEDPDWKHYEEFP